MSIVVEDGTGLVNSVSYVSVANADAYHTARGNTTWTGTNALKEAALIRATQALDARYRWPGYRSVSTQSLEWPRTDAYDIDGYELTGLPIGVINATCEAALIELLEPGALSVSVELGVRSEKVGSIQSDYYAPQKTGYPKISNCLNRIIRFTAGTIKIVRTT